MEDERRRALEAMVPFAAVVDPGHLERAGKWVSGSGGLPYVEFSDDMLALLRAAGAYGWVAPFDWPSWVPEARRFVADPALVARADVETLRRLLTTHVRRDRFFEGHRLAMVENGHLAAILERMRALLVAPEAT